MLEIFLSFLKIGVSSIGGGYATIPLIQQQVVAIHGWLTIQEFSDIITISQMTPGPLAINASSFVGMRVGGITGAIVATIGCASIGFIVSLGMYRIFTKYYHHWYIKTILQSLKATSIGLITCAALLIVLLALANMQGTNFGQVSFNGIATVIFVIIFCLSRKYHWNPITLMVVSGLLGVVGYM